MVITGNGKGKSTAGFGAVIRAHGHGLKAAVVQFISGNRECGGRNVLQQLGIDFYLMGSGFDCQSAVKVLEQEKANLAWEKAKNLLQDPSVDLVLLDEFTYMINYGYIALDDFVELLHNRPPMQDVVITGRACHRTLLEMAETVSEVRPVKHAFNSGIKPRQGMDW